jgi:hypothetical protein
VYGAVWLLLKSNISEKRDASIFRVEGMWLRGTSLAVTSRLYAHPEDGGEMSYRNVGSNKTHTMPN